jgi:predicted secreted acid phosphatase
MIPYIDENLDTYKNKLRDYVFSDSYYEEVGAVVLKAATHIKDFIGKPNICVIFDIDQTAIDQYQFMNDKDFGWDEQALEESFVITSFPAMYLILELYKNLVENKISVIFLTSKRKKYDEYTIKQLANAGYTNHTKLITRSDEDIGTIQEYKIRERKNLVSEGWNIIANVGDQQSDLDGGYPALDFCFKLPNPFYLITSEM